MKAKKTKAKKTRKSAGTAGLKVHGNLQLIPPPAAHQITRSFAFKKNMGNYESADFFCSESGWAKPGEEEKVSELLYQFCKREVARAVIRFKKIETDQGKSKQEVKEISKEAAELDAGINDI